MAYSTSMARASVSGTKKNFEYGVFNCITEEKLSRRSRVEGLKKLKQIRLQKAHKKGATDLRGDVRIMLPPLATGRGFTSGGSEWRGFLLKASSRPTCSKIIEQEFCSTGNEQRERNAGERFKSWKVKRCKPNRTQKAGKRPRSGGASGTTSSGRILASKT